MTLMGQWNQAYVFILNIKENFKYKPLEINGQHNIGKILS